MPTERQDIPVHYTLTYIHPVNKNAQAVLQMHLNTNSLEEFENCSGRTMWHQNINVDNTATVTPP